MGAELQKICYHTIPAKQWLKPSDALVIKVLESWKRKRYGTHQTIDVNYGGVLRLEPNRKADAPDPKVIDVEHAEVFEGDEQQKVEQRGGHLALAAPAKTSDEFEARTAAGEFDQAPVAFKGADGKPAQLRPDIEALRQQVAELRARGPRHPYPVDKDGRRIMPAGAPSGRGDQADDAGLGARPSPYAAPYRPPPARQNAPVLPPMPADERRIGTGVEGIGEGPDPETIGPHRGFKIA